MPRDVIKIVDVKCPDSGEPDTFQMENLDALDNKDEIKFVISTRRDYEFARDFTLQHDLAAARSSGDIFSGARRSRGRLAGNECAGSGGVDFAGRFAGTPGTAIAQIHLASGHSRRIASEGAKVHPSKAEEVYQSMNRRPKAVVLLSGGMDSCVTAAIAQANARFGLVARQLRPANRAPRAAGL